jgi:hypothetical protein
MQPPSAPGRCLAAGVLKRPTLLEERIKAQGCPEVQADQLL